MPISVDREGIFRAVAGADVAVEQSDSGAIAVAFRFDLCEMWDAIEKEWIDWPYDHEVYARVWIVKKDGTVNKHGINTLKNALDWDGEMASLGTGWNTPACQVTVVNEEYQGQFRLKASWVNRFDADPEREFKPADPALLKKIATMYGGKLRASYGARPVDSAPASPPVPAPASEPISGADDKGGVPF